MNGDQRARSESIRDQLRNHKFPEEWRAELGAVDGDTVLLMFWLDMLARRVQSAHLQEVRRLGLSASEAKLVYHLLLSGPPYRESPTRINENLDLTSGGVTKTVDRLESQGLVRRLPDSADGRSIQVELTSTGVETAQRIAQSFSKRYEEFVGPLSAEDRQTAVRTARTLLDALDGPL